MTEAEKRLWNRLRDRQFLNLKFRRQHPVPPYIADFFCEEKKLIVEVDGGQHTDDYDKNRTKYLQNIGYRVIRFWNNEVMNNIEGVLESLHDQIEEPLPHPTPLPKGEGDKKRICIAEIGPAHGVRGLVKLRLYGKDPVNPEDYNPLFTSESGDQTMTLTIKHQAGGNLVAEVEGVKDRNAAEALRGTKLWINRDALPDIDDTNVFYHADLIGLKIFDPEGHEIGTIEGVQNFGAGDLLEVKPTQGALFYLPFADEYVLEIDLKNKWLRACIPDELIH